METEDGIKVEVKSASYIQSWEQKKFSSISFDIKPRTATNSTEVNRPADVYIFCLLHHQEQLTINPMDLEQWTFYVVATSTLDDALSNQKTVGISTIEGIPHEKCTFNELKSVFIKVCEIASQSH